MIFVTHELPVNAPGEPHLDRATVWDGLVLKANNALPFVPSMTFCEVTARHGDTIFDRDIEFCGQRFTERITLEAPHRVVFTRIAGPVLGTIAQAIKRVEVPEDLVGTLAFLVSDDAAFVTGQTFYADGGLLRAS